MSAKESLRALLNDKALLKITIVIGFSTIGSMFYCLIYAVLGYLINQYPGQENLARLTVSLPGIFACIGGYLSAVLLRKISSRSLMIISYASSVLGGLICLFFGAKNIIVAIVGITICGFSSGTIPAAYSTAFARVSPEFLRDKASWFSLISAVGWMIINTIGASMAARTESWNMAFVTTFIMIIVLLAIVLYFPNEKRISEIRERYEIDKADLEAIGDISEKEVKSFMPKSVIALIVVQFFVCCFYMALETNASDLIINQLGSGSSTTIAWVSNLKSVINIIMGLVMFKILRGLKGWLATVGLGVLALGTLYCGLTPSLTSYAIGALLVGIGMGALNAGVYTCCAMAPKGEAVGTANGLINGTIYLGEALCIYIAPLAASIIFGINNASTAILTGGIMCVALAVIILPFYRSAYKTAFGASDTVLANAKNTGD